MSKDKKKQNVPTISVNTLAPPESVKPEPQKDTEVVNIFKLISTPKPGNNINDPWVLKECEQLALDVGVDWSSERQRFEAFLLQLTSLDLPLGWIKEEDPEGKLIYYNRLLKLDGAHFNEFEAKERLAGILKANAELRAQLTGIKPSEPKKVNKESKEIKDTKDGKVVVESLVNEGAQGLEKFYALRREIAEARKQFTSKTGELATLAEGEELLLSAVPFYDEHYGKEIMVAPENVKRSLNYLQVKPGDVINALDLFRILPKEPFLFWVGRFFCVLPLPPTWHEAYDAATHKVTYIHNLSEKRLGVHPGYYFVESIIRRIRRAPREPKDFYKETGLMEFVDEMFRSYEVDMTTYYTDIQQKRRVANQKQGSDIITKNPEGLKLKDSLTNYEKDPSGLLNVIIKTKMINQRKLQGIVHQKNAAAAKQLGFGNVDDQLLTDGSGDDDLDAQDAVNPNLSDEHILELMAQLGISPNEQPHLLGAVEDFVKKREPIEQWNFRKMPDGAVYWINHEQHKAVKAYPFINELKAAIKIFNDKNEQLMQQPQIYKENGLIEMLFPGKDVHEVIKLLYSEANKVVDAFLTVLKIVESKRKTVFEMKKEQLMQMMGGLIDLRPFKNSFGLDLNKNDILNIIFFCPFNLEWKLTEKNSKIHSSDYFLMQKLRRLMGKLDPELDGKRSQLSIGESPERMEGEDDDDDDEANKEKSPDRQLILMKLKEANQKMRKFTHEELEMLETHYEFLLSTFDIGKLLLELEEDERTRNNPFSELNAPMKDSKILDRSLNDDKSRISIDSTQNPKILPQKPEQVEAPSVRKKTVKQPPRKGDSRVSDDQAQPSSDERVEPKLAAGQDKAGRERDSKQMVPPKLPQLPRLGSMNREDEFKKGTSSSTRRNRLDPSKTQEKVETGKPPRQLNQKYQHVKSRIDHTRVVEVAVAPRERKPRNLLGYQPGASSNWRKAGTRSRKNMEGDLGGTPVGTEENDAGELGVYTNGDLHSEDSDEIRLELRDLVEELRSISLVDGNQGRRGGLGDMNEARPTIDFSFPEGLRNRAGSETPSKRGDKSKDEDLNFKMPGSNLLNSFTDKIRDTRLPAIGQGTPIAANERGKAQRVQASEHIVRSRDSIPVIQRTAEPQTHDAPNAESADQKPQGKKDAKPDDAKKQEEAYMQAKDWMATLAKLKQEEKRWLTPEERRALRMHHFAFGKRVVKGPIKRTVSIDEFEAKDEDETQTRIPNFLKRGDGAGKYPGVMKLRGVQIIDQREILRRVSSSGAASPKFRGEVSRVSVGDTLEAQQAKIVKQVPDTLTQILLRNIRTFKRRGSYEIGTELMRRLVVHKVDDMIFQYLIAKKILNREQFEELEHSYTKRVKFIRSSSVFFNKLRAAFLKSENLAFRLLSSHMEAIQFLSKISETSLPESHSAKVKAMSKSISNSTILNPIQHKKRRNISVNRSMAALQTKEMNWTSVSFAQFDPKRTIRLPNKNDFAMYYAIKLGRSRTLSSFKLVQCEVIPRPELTPKHVLDAGYRYHVDIRQESDTAWIFYALLSVPPPPSESGFSKLYTDSNGLAYINFILSTEAGDFPGDEYFQNVLEAVRFHRTKSFVDLNEDQKSAYLYTAAWLPFQIRGHKRYYKHNFYTNEAVSI